MLMVMGALAACGGVNEMFPSLSRQDNLTSEAAQSESLIKSDPAGPIPKPQVPALPTLAAERAAPAEELVKYKVQVNPDDPKEMKEIKEAFQETADLFVLADKPVLNPMTLTRRLRSSLEKGQDVLKSKGYYEGQVTAWMEKKDNAEETLVVVNFQLGPLYRLGTSRVTARTQGDPGDQGSPEADGPKDAGVSEASQPKPPKAQGPEAAGGPGQAATSPKPSLALNDREPPTVDLAPAGWVSGDPALADQVLSLVDQNVVIWTARGYPEAKTLETHYYLDPEKKLLSAEVVVDPGFFALMGPLVISGDGEVEDQYVANLVNWKVGQVWDKPLLDRFVDSMFQTGLFKSVETTIGEEDQAGRRPILVEISSTQFQTVAGSVNFDSDFGPGVILSWEHRNLTSWGDRLRLEFPAWADLIQFGASYVRPYFLSRHNNLLMDLSLIHEKADSYTLDAVSADAGLERRLSRHLTGLFQIRLEAGKLAELLKPSSQYTVYGLPITLEWDFSDDLLNPTKGTRFKVSLQPFMGDYFDQFKVLKTRLDGSVYFPILADGRLVLALRAAAGGMWGAERTKLPATLRYYGGGGGSVRGYKYQSIGPRNERDKPDGGGAMAEVGGEIRFRWSDSMGATVFVDGGMVYDRPEMSQIGQSFLWGGGVGFRYFTPIGPFRLDLATPLTPRDDDGPLQFYLSLGQSF